MSNAPQLYPDERWFPDEEQAADAGWPRWVDAHSVTCVICGGLADERETIKIDPDRHDHPPTREMIELVEHEFGHGEAHEGCYDRASEVLP